MLIGRGQLLRTSKGPTRLSASFFVERMDSIRADGESLRAELHTGRCNSPNQVPYDCSTVAGGCLVGVPTRATFELSLHSTEENNVEGMYSWPVHIPNKYEHSLSLVVRDPTNVTNTMACADLVKERSMTGSVTMFSNDRNAGYNPSLVGAEVVVSELGQSEFRLELASLRPGSNYPAFVHSLPCITADGTAGFPGPRYKRSALCVDDPADAACDAAAENEVWLSVHAEADGKASTKVVVSNAVRSSVRSISYGDICFGICTTMIEYACCHLAKKLSGRIALCPSFPLPHHQRGRNNSQHVVSCSRAN